MTQKCSLPEEVNVENRMEPDNAGSSDFIWKRTVDRWNGGWYSVKLNIKTRPAQQIWPARNLVREGSPESLGDLKAMRNL